MVPLTTAQPGETHRILKICGRDEMRQRIGELGFVTDEALTVIARNGDNMIVAVKGYRIALDQALAMRIMI